MKNIEFPVIFAEPKRGNRRYRIGKHEKSKNLELANIIFATPKRKRQRKWAVS